MAYTAQFRSRRFKSDKTKAFGEKLCVEAATTQINLHKPVPSRTISPHLNLHCQVPEASTFQLLPSVPASPQSRTFPSWAPLVMARTVLCVSSIYTVQLLDDSIEPYGPNCSKRLVHSNNFFCGWFTERERTIQQVGCVAFRHKVCFSKKGKTIG